MAPAVVTTTSRLLATIRRPRGIGAVIALALLALSACDPSSGGTPTTTATIAPSVAPTTAGPTTAVAPIASSIADAAAYFTDSLARLATGYEFSGSVTVGGAVATTVEGRTIAGVTEMTIVSGTATLELITGPEGQWAREPGEEWAILEGPPPATDPLAALAAPLSVGVLENAATGVVLEGVYPADALGLPAGDPVPVRFTIVDGFLAAIDYATAAQGADVAVSTSLRPLADPTPITVPAAG